MIEIVSTLPFTSIQDLGREGHRGLGIVRGGVMDRVALMAANLLVGNSRSDAGLEIEMPPVRIRFHQSMRVAVTGAYCEVLLDGVRLAPWWGFTVLAGQILEVLPGLKGMRSYIAFSGGGIDVPLILGSRSTHLRIGLGGLEGRRLIAGDKLSTCQSPDPSAIQDESFGIVPAQRLLSSPVHECAEPGDIVLRVIPAGEFSIFTPESQSRFFSESWKVSTASNRQGARLEGEPLILLQKTEMRSHGIVTGVIQVPPSGMPMIQLSDANSAGGYPKIGVVIEADLWRIAQASPGSKLRFYCCTLEEAQTAKAETEKYLYDIQWLVNKRKPLNNKTLKRT